MSKELKRHIVSFGITFAATFFTLVGANLSQLSSETVSIVTLSSLVLSAGRSALKVVFESYTEKAK